MAFNPNPFGGLGPNPFGGLGQFRQPTKAEIARDKARRFAEFEEWQAYQRQRLKRRRRTFVAIVLTMVLAAYLLWCNSLYVQP